MLGYNIDKVINEVSCELMMLQTNGKLAESILLPIADPQQIPFALQAAQLYAVDENTSLDILHIIPPDTATADKDAILRTLQRRVDGVRLNQAVVNILIRESADPRSPIVDVSKEYDLLVLGATRDTWLKRRFFGNTPVAIARESDTPVILLRPEGSRIQFGMRQTLNYLRGGYAEVQPDSRQRLIDQGFLDDEQEADKVVGLKSSINKNYVFIIGVLTVIAAFLMFFGDGDTLTWIGAVAYLVLLLVFTWLAVTAPAPIHENPQN